MKNQTKRIEDAKVASQRKKRPRIGDKNSDQNNQTKRVTAEDLERARIRKMMRVDTQVWEIINKAKAAEAKREQAMMGDPLELPFKTGRERLLYNKQKYANMSIAQAFAAAYDLPEPINIGTGNNLPKELIVGDVIDLTIASISKKGGVVFNSGSYKENFSTRNNLARYEKFAKVLPVESLKAKIIEIGPKSTIVDIYTPMIDEFVRPRAASPWIQNTVLTQAQPILVKNLRLTKGGYMGQAVIPNISEFVGEDFTIDAFIPGSQIVLNTTDDFEQYDGTDQWTFITSYAPKPNGRGMSLVCSVKNYLKHCGNMTLRQIHSVWCDADEKWEKLSTERLAGKVTGVLNSSKKCGVFVEIPDWCITGMIPMPAEELVNYPAGQELMVRLNSLEEDMAYNDQAGQMQHLPPFEIVDGAIKRVNIKPIFELAL